MVALFEPGIMKKFILTILCNAVLLLTLCLPADARMTICYISTSSLSGVNQGNIDQISELPRAYAHGIIKAKLCSPAGVLSSGYFHPQVHACGITV